MTPIQKRLLPICLCPALAILALVGPAFAASEGGSPAVSAPAAPTPVEPRPSVPPQTYRISSGDTLSITAWGEERFSQECQVNGAGTISYPILGDVRAAGLTCSELQANLEQGLRKYLKRPQLIVTVRQYGALGTSMFVLGEVKTPGVYPVTSGSTLMQALAAAGGPTSFASGTITVVKARTGEFRDIGLEAALGGAASAPDATPEPGDVILVNRKAEADQAPRYTVLGEVPSPGVYDMPTEGEVHVLDAMQKAGLLRSDSGARAGARNSIVEEQSRTADLEHALLARGEVVVPLNLTALLQGDTSQNLPLQSGDVITVPRRSLMSIYAMGEVRSPGQYQLPPNSTVLDLLNAAGGVTSASKLSGCSIVRLVDDKPTPTPVDLGRLLGGADPKQNVRLQGGDVLFVPTKGQPRRDFLGWLTLMPYLLRF